MKAWQKAFRDGLVPQLSREHLQALKDGLEHDDPHLIQKATSQPPPLQCCKDWPVEGACPIGYCSWKTGELEIVDEVQDFFGITCWTMDQLLGEPAACRYFINWWDDTPREIAVPLLLEEVKLAIKEKENNELG